MNTFHKKMSEWTVDYGNRCGHNPSGETLSVAKGLKTSGKGAHPKLLQKACVIIDELFHTPTKFLRHLFFREDRLVRSEFREAICKVLKTLMKFFDIATGRIIVPDQDGVLQNITLGVIAQHAGMSEDRCTNTWSYLQSAGVVSSQELYEERDGQKRGLASVKWLSFDFFNAIGLGKWFSSDHEKRKELAKTRKYRAELKKNHKKSGRKADQAEQRMRLKGMMGKVFGKKTPHTTKTKSNPMTDYDEYNRQVKAETSRLHKETKMPIADCYDIALQTIKRH